MKIFQDWFQISDDMAVILSVAEEATGRTTSIRLIPDPTKNSNARTETSQHPFFQMLYEAQKATEQPSPELKKPVISGQGVVFISKDMALLKERLLEVSDALRYFALKVDQPGDLFNELGNIHTA